MCLCSSVTELVETFDSCRAEKIASDLTRHLGALRSIIAKSKALSRGVGYQIIPNNQRTSKIFLTKGIDTDTTKKILDRYRDITQGFWDPSAHQVPAELRRRLTCVIISLRSSLDIQDWVPHGIDSFIQGHNVSELRYAGRKYIKMARRLGGVGSILCLPLDIPSSTYERYLHIDDNEAFNHLQAVCSAAPDCHNFVQHLIGSQFDDSHPMRSKYNLLMDYGDFFPASDRLLLLLTALGGSAIPVDVLKSVRGTQRRWGSNGEIETFTAVDFGLPVEIVNLLMGDTSLAQAAALPEITEGRLDDGTVVWTVRGETIAAINGQLTPKTKETWALTALRLLCFACPPCYEGEVNWTPEKKQALWALLDKATTEKTIPPSQKTQAIDALLYFAERDNFAIRRAAIERARAFLHKAMNFYFHAGVALFGSIISRFEGRFDASNAEICEFLLQSPDANTRTENALKGRLHISWIENRIHQGENDVASVMYDWEGTYPLSSFETEVTRRLQGTAAKFFHSIGDFATAKASLEQHLHLASTQPVREKTRLLITAKLAEIYCELGGYDKARELIQPEIDNMTESQMASRPFRRQLLVSVEADLGESKLESIDPKLQLLAHVEPTELDDLNDQIYHMRRLILISRTAHENSRFREALDCWQAALRKMELLSIFSMRHPWTAVAIHLSIAHAQLRLGDVAGSKESWSLGSELSKTERCEYTIPTLAGVWVPRIVSDVHGEQGWPFRIMLPGRQPDLTWL